MSIHNRIYLSSPHMSGLEQHYINQAFETNWIAPLGPNVDAFERELADYVGVKGAAALSSGTAAIHLALRLLGVGQGNIVICSSLTFAASANPILYLGAEPVFIDAEPESWNMSPQALERALSDARKQGIIDKVKAVIVVDLYGQSADMDAICEICDYYGVPIVEDAAESLGAFYFTKRKIVKDSATKCVDEKIVKKRSGTFGKFGIYSFNGNKIITTSGGGMLVSDDLDALQKARFWATQARDKALHYQHSEMGYNYRMSNILAGIGRGQLQVLEQRVEQRREVFQRYYDALSGIPGAAFMPEADFGRSNRWLTALTLDPSLIKVKPSELCDLFAEHNIEARPVWKPLHLQPLFKGAKYYPHNIHNIAGRTDYYVSGTTDEYLGSVSDEIFTGGICLPSGSNMTLEQQQRVIDVLIRALL